MLVKAEGLIRLRTVESQGWFPQQRQSGGGCGINYLQPQSSGTYPNHAESETAALPRPALRGMKDRELPPALMGLGPLPPIGLLGVPILLPAS